MDVTQYMAVFLDEADEQLQQLNSLLLELEKNPEDLSILNDIFRIAHTLKGMSATMGFENMADMTHKMENALDKMRKGEVKATPEIVDMLFKCLDTLQAMVEAIRSGESDSNIDTSEIIRDLKRVVGEEEEREKQEKKQEESMINEYEVDVIRKGVEEGFNPFKITVKLRKDAMLKSARAYMVINRLEQLGDIVKTVPSVEDLEEEKFEDSFVVFLLTKESADTIKNTVLSIAEIVDAVVESVDVEGEKKAEEPKEEKKEAEEKAKEETKPEAAVQQKEEKKPAEKSKAGKSAETEKVVARALSHKISGYRTVRVDIHRLDVLMNLVGELVISRTRLEQIGKSHHLTELDETLAQFGRIIGELQALVMKLRMVPIENVFDRFPRLVRDLSKAQGKEIEFIVEGKETELDRTVIDEIGDPLVHLIRNAIDHGIEPPEEREKVGKPRKGKLRLAARHEGNSVVIEVEDDGRGMDPEKIKKKAIERGLITPEEAEHMSKYEILMLTTVPGFSTAEKVTDISGRGVGLDVVKSKVESLNGQLLIESEVGKGTKIIIKLPLTLAIIQALLTKVSDEIYAVPLENIDETLALAKEDIKLIQNKEVTLLRGEVLPLMWLRDALGVPGERSNEEEEEAVVVVRMADRRVGIVVDELVGQQEIVIKSLGKFLKGIQGLAGATILGDGRVALILDVSSL